MTFPAVDTQALIKAVKGNPALFAELFPEQAKQLVGKHLVETDAFAGYPGTSKTYQSYKHGSVDNTNQIPDPINEDAFFVDCTLADPIISATLFPTESIISMIPVRNRSVRQRRYGFVTNIQRGSPRGAPVAPCDDPNQANTGIDACKFLFEFGRAEEGTRTGEIDHLITSACDGLYDTFFFVGENGFSANRGNSDIPAMLSMDDRDLIVEAALRYEMASIGRDFSLWFAETFWTGDPANDTAQGGYKEYFGILNLIRNDWDTTADFANYLTSSTGDQADCSNLNSCVMDFESECVCTGANSLYDFLQTLENEAWSAAGFFGLKPFEAWIVMHPIMWGEIVKCLPCEMISNGCNNNSAVVNLNDGGNGMFNFEERRRLMDSLTIDLNGRTYPIRFDHHLPIVETNAGGNWQYTSPIVFLPIKVKGNEEVLFFEHKNYALNSPLLTNRLNGLVQEDMAQLSAFGWTDGGKFLMTLKQTSFCFEVDIKTEPALVFLAPHIAGRIDNVQACFTKRQRLPEGFNTTLFTPPPI